MQTTKFTFKVKSVYEVNEGGTFTHYDTPIVNEDLFYYQFDTPEKALSFLQNRIEEQTITEDEIQEWELCEVVTKEIPNAISKFNSK